MFKKSLSIALKLGVVLSLEIEAFRSPSDCSSGPSKRDLHECRALRTWNDKSRAG